MFGICGTFVCRLSTISQDRNFDSDTRTCGGEPRLSRDEGSDAKDNIVVKQHLPELLYTKYTTSVYLLYLACYMTIFVTINAYSFGSVICLVQN